MPDQIYGVKWNGQDKVKYTYDGLGRLTGKQLIVGQGLAPAVLNNTYTYENVNSTRTTTLVKTVQTAIGTYTYTYDNVGNIVSIHDGTYTTSYEYDSLNQLVRENDQRADVTYTYSYVNGNITAKKAHAYTVGELGRALEISHWTYGDSTWTDLVTEFDGTVMTYDAIGNPITLDDYDLTWCGRQLQSVSDGVNTFTYQYNADGQRISKDFDGTTTEFFYNGSILAGQKTGNDVIVFMYDNNGDIFGFVYNGTEYYYVKNAQNDVVAIADASGTVIANYYYDAWGRIIDITGDHTIAYINPILYRSYYYDYESGFYYLNSRYYSPDLCRFLNADNQLSTGNDLNGTNLFTYCSNNPVKATDPSGHAWYHWAIGVGIVAGLAVATVVSAGSLPAAMVAFGFAASGVSVGGVTGGLAMATIGSAYALGAMGLAAAFNSNTVSDFNAQGNWGTVAVTAGAAVTGYISGYSKPSQPSKPNQTNGRGTQNPKVKEAVQKGQAMHKQMDYGPGVIKEKTIAPGCRVDGIDFNNKIIYELKPNNPQAITRGMNQLDRYTAAASQQYGGKWIGVLVLYD